MHFRLSYYQNQPRFTSVGIQSLIVDAVSVVFIMDIDNMARDAIQR
jgi:hypothetical protein